MPYSTTYANNFLGLTFSKVSASIAPPSTVYIGLCSNDPEADGGNVTELSGNGYARVLIAQKGETYPNVMGSAANREIKNSYQINWPKATANWARVKGFFLSSSPTVGETTSIFFYGKLDLTAEDEAAGGLLVEKDMIALFDPQAFQISFPTSDSE